MSALALVALIFGLAAPLCFWAPILMVIPLVGAALATIALRRIAVSDGALTGQGVALAALALSLASVAASVSHDRVTRYLRSNQAEELARQWIGLLIAGRTQAAFDLTVEGSRPPAPPGPGEPTPKETPIEAFTKAPMVQALIAAGPDSTVRFERTLSYSPMSSGQVVIEQEYSVTPRGSGPRAFTKAQAAASTASQPASPIRVALNLQRSRLAGEKNLHWLVLSFRDVNAPVEPTHGL